MFLQVCAGKIHLYLLHSSDCSGPLAEPGHFNPLSEGKSRKTSSCSDDDVALMMIAFIITHGEIV